MIRIVRKGTRSSAEPAPARRMDPLPPQSNESPAERDHQSSDQLRQGVSDRADANSEREAETSHTPSNEAAPARDRVRPDRRGRSEGSKRTHFQTGVGGNRKGRPKRSRSLGEALERPTAQEGAVYN